MKIQVRHILTFLNQWAPPETQLDYDNVGLLVGNTSKRVTNVLTCLDITPAVVEEAIEKKCELIVSHHPTLFNGIKNIDPDTEQGKILYQLIKHDVAVIAAHTNLDAAPGGVSFVLAETLGLNQIGFLDQSYNVSRKVIFTTQHGDRDAILELLNDYSAEEPLAHTVQGKKSQQYRYEATMDHSNIRALKKQLKKDDLLENGRLETVKIDNPTNNAGMGAFGSYRDKGLQQEDFLARVADRLNVEALRFSGQTDYIKRVAVCGGAGVALTQKAVRAGAQAFVTADIKYHDYFTDIDNFLLVDAGHYQTEWPIVAVLENELTQAFEDVEVTTTSVITNPMKVYSPI